MSRGKRIKAERRHHRERQEELEDNVVRDTAAVFTCSSKTADDFAAQCKNRREELECDIVFNRVAHEIWAGRPGHGAQIADALSALLAERLRHDEALADLGQRFAAMADENVHEHLDPIETYRDLVRQRVFEHPPPAPA